MNAVFPPRPGETECKVRIRNAEAQESQQQSTWTESLMLTNNVYPLRIHPIRLIILRNNDIVDIIDVLGKWNQIKFKY